MPRLTYYELRGRAEAIRLLLIDQGIPFEDERLDAQAWRKRKPAMPFGQLPVYEDEYGVHGQAAAILRHLARTQMSTPTDPAWWVKADQVHEALAEAQESLWRFAWNEAYRNNRDKYARRELKHYLSGLSAMRGDKTYFTGSEIAHVDYLAAVYLDEVATFFGELDTLSSFREMIYARSNLSSYVESGRRPIVFGMGLDGPKYAPEATSFEREKWPNPWAKDD